MEAPRASRQRIVQYSHSYPRPLPRPELASTSRVAWGPASPLQQLVLDGRALRAELHEEGAGGRARPQVPQLVVVGPLDVAPLLDLRGGRDRPLGDWPEPRRPIAEESRL